MGHHAAVPIDHGPPTFDLQSHSTCSDGALDPAAVVAAAASAGVRLLALTDHDTVAGVSAAQAAAAEHGIALVPAVEVSTIDVLGEDFHVLGYGIDHTDAALGERLDAWRGDRAARIDRMADLLTELGLPPDRSEIETRRSAGLPVGRPHLATAAIAANRERLEADGLAECSAFLEAYLCRDGPAYSRRTTPTVAERSRRSTGPAASPSGRTRSGISRATRTCAPRSSASAPPASTGSRPSTRPTMPRRRAC